MPALLSRTFISHFHSFDLTSISLRDLLLLYVARCGSLNILLSNGCMLFYQMPVFHTARWYCITKGNIFRFQAFVGGPAFCFKKLTSARARVLWTKLSGLPLLISVIGGA